MVRTQIEFTEEQARELEEAARREGVSVAELILRTARRIAEEHEDDAKWRRALAIAGKYRSEFSDIAKNHDDYLAEDFR